jgi:very-short-patch-repair endonuclease
MPDGIAYERAKAFRKRMTPPEARLWRCLRANQFRGLKFRRQHPVGPYILDFYCAGGRLAVEVDGSVHDIPERAAHDRRRTRWLATQGIKVIRLRATDVRDELDGVLSFIGEAARGRFQADRA